MKSRLRRLSAAPGLVATPPVAAAAAPTRRLLHATPVSSRAALSSWQTAVSGSAPGVGGASLTPNEDPSASLGRHFYLNKVLEQYASRPATRITLRQLVFFGRRLGGDREKILRSANYVRQELPVRLAHRIRDLQALPFVVMTNPNLGQVYNKYWHAFETFRRFAPIRNMEENEAFCATLKAALDDHLTIIPSLTVGIVEASHHLPAEKLDKFMERMLRSRISRRVLAEQHIALSAALDDPFHFFNDSSSTSNAPKDQGEHVGIIYTQLCVSSVVKKGIKLLRQMFARELGLDVNDEWIPHVEIDGDLAARFAYIPDHLEYIVFELLKNAMSAVMKRPMEDRDDIPIRVTIVEGPPDEDLIVRISDCGGGLPDLVEQISATENRYLLPPKAAAHAHPILAAASAGHPLPRSDDELPSGSLDLEARKEAAASWAAPRPKGTELRHDATAGDQALIDVLTSFSSVRKRLALEEEMAKKRAGNEDRGRSTGLGSKERLERLKSVKFFKGTVAEQVASRPNSSTHPTPSILTSSSTPEPSDIDEPRPSWVPRGDDGTPAHAARRETGLGLPMTRIYTEFLGGRLSLRSVDGGGLDVYLRLQKLGDTQEAIDDIEL